MKLKRDTKFGEESTCHFKIGIRNLTKFDPSTRKSKKNLILMGSFWAKCILLELKKYRGVILHETEEGYKLWRGIDSSFQNWHKEFDKILTGALKSLKKIHFNELLLNKVYIVWAEKVQKNNLSWNWRGIQNLERNRVVVSKLA